MSEPVRSIEDWVGVLKPLGYWDAADVILDHLDDYPKKVGELNRLLNENRADDKNRLGNALIAWAMLTAIEIETELGLASPEQEQTPRHTELLVKALADLQAYRTSSPKAEFWNSRSDVRRKYERPARA
jgi:hypothetical protein